MSDPKEILERRLQKVAETQDTHGLHFFFQIGGNDDALGLTTLQIAGSGRTLLSWKYEGESKLFSVEISKSDLVKFYRILSDHPFWDATPLRRPREDGETNIHLRFADQAAGTYSVLQFWDRDIDEFPILTRLLTPVAHLIRMIADDEIPHLPIERDTP